MVILPDSILDIRLKDIVDYVQKMMCRGADLAEILLCLLRSLRIIHCQIIEAYDRVHGRPYLMAHVGQECALGEVSLLRIGKSIAGSLTLRKSPSRLGVHIGKTRPDMVDVTVDNSRPGV